LLEAMTTGMPVVTTRVAGIPSLVTHDVNGLLVDEPTPASIADALARLLSDPGLRRRLIANGYETARAHTLEGQAARMMCEVSSRLHVTLRQPAPAPAA
jgi:glycosyltransferase involved in cell wall biosynthesis